MIVVCIDNDSCETFSLTLGKRYQVIEKMTYKNKECYILESDNNIMTLIDASRFKTISQLREIKLNKLL